MDALILGSATVQFDLIWRRGSNDMELATWTESYSVAGEGSSDDAQMFEYDESAPAIDYQSGDQLVLRYTGTSLSVDGAYAPNGDGASANGRIPNLTLPK